MKSANKKITSFFIYFLYAVVICSICLAPSNLLAEVGNNFKASMVPSDEYYNKQWYLKKINAPKAWNIINESKEVVIAIIDSGVQIDHPDLKENIWINEDEIPNNEIDDDKNGYIDDLNGWDFVNDISDPEPKFEENFTRDGVLHGTIVAGVAAAYGNNNLGISGITWKAKIMPLKVLDDAGEGDVGKVVRAVNYAVDNGADIINFSFVGTTNSFALRDAIQEAYDEGLIIVAAAGNDQENSGGHFLDNDPLYPACYKGRGGENIVIGVAATDALDQKASFSSYGNECIDISAPGTSIFSTAYYSPNIYLGQDPFNKYYDGYWSGTSIATPMVSGAIALVGNINSTLSRDKIINIIKSNADDISRLNPDYPGQLGGGRLNLYKSVLAAKSLLSTRRVNLFVASATNGTSSLTIIDRKGEFKDKFSVYGGNFRGGVNVAAGDIDGDGIDEIITGAGNGGGPQVRMFKPDGKVIGQFFAYDKNFRGGVNVAAGDIDGDGIDEIITGAGNGGGPQVRMFKPDGKVIGQFFAYDKNFRGGVRVDTINTKTSLGGKKKEKIITSPGQGMEPRIKIFNNQAELISKFEAYGSNFKGGVYLASGDINGDGIDEVITGAGQGGAPHLRIFEESGRLIESFFALEKNFIGGISVGLITY